MSTLNTANPQPGLYPQVPLADYLRLPLLSQSTLKEGRASMAHLRAALDGERITVPTDDMLLGSALHVCYLEPELMTERVVRWDGGRRFGKEWEAFKDDHEGKIILTEGLHDSLVGMVRALRAHRVVRDWVGKIEATEVVAVGMVEGIRMKARADALTEGYGPLFDLKKVSTGDQSNFTRLAIRLGYDIQAHIYRTLFGRDRFVFITVEDQEPYDVAAYEMTSAWFRRGERATREIVEQYLDSKKTGVWPGRAPCEILPLELPEWAEGAMPEITINGQSAFGG